MEYACRDIHVSSWDSQLQVALVLTFKHIHF